ncbi:MAG: TA system VapC family ribonuclease toxin [Myxococcota bacterium]
MFAVDTNVLVYAHFDLYPQHQRARRFVEVHLLGDDDWCMGWQVYYEYLRIVTHPKIHKAPLTLAQAIGDLDVYVRSPRCQMLSHTPQHRQILEAVTRRVEAVSGNLVHDCHYAALLHEHGIQTIYTADADFRRFDFLEVIDPTAA